MTQSTDRIEKVVTLNAPQERVWSAISDSSQFGRWFGARIAGAFEPGARLDATIQPTEVDPEVGKMQEPYAGMEFEIVVERVEPPRLLSFRWHPGDSDTEEVADEPMTLVTFELEPVEGGTRLTITESGFDALPDARRAEAYEMNEGGWEHQSRLIAKYLERTAGA
jgi:uncharacterized protein YndB with AHSA1/START domain